MYMYIHTMRVIFYCIYYYDNTSTTALEHKVTLSTRDSSEREKKREPYIRVIDMSSATARHRRRRYSNQITFNIKHAGPAQGQC